MRVHLAHWLCVVVVFFGGCKESPFATLPETPRCGSEGAPCHYRCDLKCVALAVSSATDCLIPLEGKLAADRRSCSFDDGSEARFTDVLPQTQTALNAQGIGVSLVRQGSTCLTVSAIGAATASDPQETSVSIGDQRYAQKVWRDFAADGGSVPITRIEVRCQSGQHYLGEGPTICSECSSDGGCPASPPLVGLRVILGSSIQFLLEGDQRTTPLFTCRP